MSAVRRLAAMLAGTALAGAPLLGGTPASAAGEQKCAAPARTVVRDAPWAQRALGPDRAWVLTRGGGLVVGVVDTGVSAASPALAGAVLPGRDVATNRAANTDCRGHGTFVAGLLAARPMDGRGLVGIAPAARVLPIRVSPDEKQVDAGRLAAGIRAAVDGGARVVAVAVGVATAPPALRAAVTHAHDRDVVVVASTDAPDAISSDSGGSVFPADLPGVIAVASIQSDGRPASSGAGASPAIAAPGAGLVSVAPQGNGNVTASGGGVAVAFVAGAAALVRDYRPTLKADEVLHRLEATADHPTGRLPDPQLGYGMVDPVAAVTTALPEESGEAAPKPQARPVKIVIPAPKDRSGEHLALVASAAVAGAAALGGLVVATVRRGRQRGWRPGGAEGG
ncbi:S8 family serine peptidase [Actinomadura sp. DC4]|uniref:S8 family serine peptidase n=1 Tax=Actinomadura sp. DC4 TaxID=3055069 RepID=UPI0025B17EEC|nr:S8 family serine peptidase [Actinomadura sp. DC4]MDN3357656.1 S8 family serine peptidase [Actinomadura sp. DC4]